MKVGDMIRVKNGSGCYEDGEDTTCFWPESKGQIGVVLEMISDLSFTAARVMVLGEIVEFDVRGLETINESR